MDFSIIFRIFVITKLFKMNYKEKAIKVTDDILSAVGKKDDPIKELLVVYIEKALTQAYEDGLRNGGQPF